jgi:hypothetical protein
MFTDKQVVKDALRGSTEEVTAALAWVGPKGQHVDPTTEDNHAVRLAACGGCLEVVRAFLAWVGEGELQGLRVDPTTGQNCAVRSAASRNHVEVVRLLLEWVGQGTLEGKRVDPTAVNEEAVWWAAEKGHVGVFRVLLDWVGQGTLEGKRVGIEDVRGAAGALWVEIRPVFDEAERARAEWRPTRVAWIGAVVRAGFSRRLSAPGGGAGAGAEIGLRL